MILIGISRISLQKTNILKKVSIFADNANLDFGSVTVTQPNQGTFVYTGTFLTKVNLLDWISKTPSLLGPFVNGDANGNGTLVFIEGPLKGDSYVGPFKDNQFHTTGNIKAQKYEQKVYLKNSCLQEIKLEDTKLQMEMFMKALITTVHVIQFYLSFEKYLKITSILLATGIFTRYNADGTIESVFPSKDYEDGGWIWYTISKQD